MFEELAAWVEERGGRVGCGVGLQTTQAGAGRVFTPRERKVESGETLVRIPFSLAINLRTALRRLAGDQKARRNVTRSGLRAFVEFCKASISRGKVSSGSTISLLVALQILSEAADPEARLRPYTTILPAPKKGKDGNEDSLASTIKGPVMTHPILWSEKELEQTQNPTLVGAVLKEQEMLRYVYENALCAEHIEYEDFLWAIAIVRSRSLNLSLLRLSDTADEEENLQCMLPVIDLCDHSAEANCSLRCCLSKDGGSINAIELVAQSDIDPGATLTIDYGHRGLRDFFRVYGFTPDSPECRSEIFEDVSNPLESVFVNGHRKGTFFSLSKIVVVSSLLDSWPCRGREGGAASTSSALLVQKALVEASLLLDGDGCSCLYEIEDESPHLHTISSFRQCPRVSGAENASCSEPGQEEKAIKRVLDFLKALLEGMPTTLAEDQRLLLQNSSHHPQLAESLQTALRYRVARKALLESVMEDLLAAQRIMLTL